MAEFNIAVVAGDGIGPEVTGEAVKVLEKIGEKFNVFPSRYIIEVYSYTCIRKNNFRRTDDGSGKINSVLGRIRR